MADSLAFIGGWKLWPILDGSQSTNQQFKFQLKTTPPMRCGRYITRYNQSQIETYLSGFLNLVAGLHQVEFNKPKQRNKEQEKSSVKRSSTQATNHQEIFSTQVQNRTHTIY